MDKSKLLDRLTIPTPCPVAWSQMEGDDRTRFCRSCRKHVYNFSAMDSDEIVDLIREKEGKLCAQLYRRRDGTVVTRNCRKKSKRNLLQFSLASLMTLVTTTWLSGITGKATVCALSSGIRERM